MNEREAFLLIQACNSVETYLTQGAGAAVESLDILMPEVGESVEAFSYLAVTAASICGGLVGASPVQVLDGLARTEIQLLPAMGIDWDAGLQLIRLVANKSPNKDVIAAGSSMDVPTAINSSFSVAVAAITYLAEKSGKSPVEWISILRTGAVRET